MKIRPNVRDVTILFDAFVPSGMTLNVLRLARATSGEVRYRVLSACDGALREQYEEFCDVEVWGGPYHKWVLSPYFAAWVADRLHARPPTLVHAHQLGSVAAALDAWRGPLVCSWHSRLDHLAEHRSVIAAACMASEAVFAYGIPVVEDLRAFGVTDVIATWGGDIASAAPPPGDDGRVVAIGRLEPRKCFDTLISAMREVPTRLEIFGDGELRGELSELVACCGLEHRVRVVGWSQDVWGQAAGAALLVCCSRSEGTPSVVLEAMSRDVPVLGSAVVTPTIVPFDPTVASCPCDDAAELGRAITARLVCTDRARHARRIGRRVRAALSQTCLARQLLSIYGRAGAQRRPLTV